MTTKMFNHSSIMSKLLLLLLVIFVLNKASESKLFENLEQYEYCSPEKCRQAGACVKLEYFKNPYTCICVEPYKGEFCEQRTKYCNYMNWCPVGKCRSYYSNFYCQCREFGGRFCNDSTLAHNNAEPTFTAVYYPQVIQFQKETEIIIAYKTAITDTKLYVRIEDKVTEIDLTKAQNMDVAAISGVMVNFHEKSADQTKMFKHKHFFLYSGFGKIEVEWSPPHLYPNTNHYGYNFQFEYFVSKENVTTGTVRMQGGALATTSKNHPRILLNNRRYKIYLVRTPNRGKGEDCPKSMSVLIKRQIRPVSEKTCPHCDMFTAIKKTNNWGKEIKEVFHMDMEGGEKLFGVLATVKDENTTNNSYDYGWYEIAPQYWWTCEGLTSKVIPFDSMSIHCSYYLFDSPYTERTVDNMQNKQKGRIYVTDVSFKNGLSGVELHCGQNKFLKCNIVRKSKNTEIKVGDYENLIKLLKATSHSEDLLLQVKMKANGKDFSKQWWLKQKGWIGDWFEIKCFRHCTFNEHVREVTVDPNEGYVWLHQVCLHKLNGNDNCEDHKSDRWSLWFYENVQVRFLTFLGIKSSKDKLMNLTSLLSAIGPSEGSFVLQLVGPKYQSDWHFILPPLMYHDQFSCEIVDFYYAVCDFENVIHLSSYRIYQRVEYLQVDYGILLSVGYTMPTALFMLAPTASLYLYIEVASDITGAVTRYVYDSKEIVRSIAEIYETDRAFHILNDIISGKWSIHPSIEFNINMQEISQASQKVQRLLIEFKILHKMAETFELQDQIVSAEWDFKRDLFESFEANPLTSDTNEVSEIIQIFTLFYAIIHTDPPPLDELVIQKMPALLKSNLDLLIELIKKDSLRYHLKVRTMFETLQPFFDVCFGLLLPYGDQVITPDPVTGKIIIQPSVNLLEMEYLEITLSPVEIKDKMKLGLPSYDTEVEKSLTGLSVYAKAAILTMKSFIKSLDIFKALLEPLPEDHEYFNPHFEYISPNGVKKKERFYLYIQNFHSKHMPIEQMIFGIRGVATVGLSQRSVLSAMVDKRKVNADDGTPLNIQIAILSFNPYILIPKTLPVLDLAYIVHFTNKAGNAITSEFSYQHPVRSILKDTFTSGSFVEEVAAFKVNVNSKFGKNLIIQFGEPLKTTFLVLFKEHYPPTVSDYLGSNSRMIQINLENDRYLQYQIPDSEKGIHLYIGIKAVNVRKINLKPASHETSLPAGFLVECLTASELAVKATPKFTLAVYSAACVGAIFDSVSEDIVEESITVETKYSESVKWEPICSDLKILAHSLEINCTCKSGQAKVFSTAFKVYQPLGISGATISIVWNPESNFLVFGIFLVLVIFFGIAYSYAKNMDQADATVKPTLYLVDNREYEQYTYVIIVVTGNFEEAGTTAKIGLKIFGTEGNSKRHILAYWRNPRYIFKPRSVILFALTTSDYLGRIRALEMWSDYTGTKPNWYLEKIIVRNYNTMREWVFVVQKWFSVLYGDAKLHRIIYQTRKKRGNLIKQILNLEDFQVFHCYIGMFSWEFCHVLTRRIKLLFAVTRITVGIVIMMLYFGIASFDYENPYDYDFVDMNSVAEAVNFAFLINLIIIFPLMYLYRNAWPKKVENLEYMDYSGQDPVALVPIYYYQNDQSVQVSWLMIIISGGGLFFILFYGFTFGSNKSYMLLFGTIMFIFLDAFVVETLHLIVRNFCWRICMHRDDTQRFCNDLIDVENIQLKQCANSYNAKFMLPSSLYKPVEAHMIQILREKELAFHDYRWIFKALPLFLLNVALGVYLFVYLTSDGNYTKTVIEKMVSGNYTPGQLQLHNVFNHNTTYAYINSTFRKMMYWEIPDVLIMASFKMIGVPRLRQIRVHKGMYCTTPAEFDAEMDSCIAPVEYGNMDTGNYYYHWSERGNASALVRMHYQAFLYKDAKSEPITIDGYKYPGGGHSTTLGRTENNLQTILNGLGEHDWLDFRTVIVFIEFVTYNGDANTIGNVKIVMEAMPNGHYRPIIRISTIRAYSRGEVFSTMMDFMVLILLIAMMANLFTSIFQTLSEQRGYLYYTSFFSAIEIVILILSLLAFILYYLRFLKMASQIGLADNTVSSFVSFDEVTYYDDRFRYFYALMLVTCVIRCFRFFRMNSTIHEIEFILQYCFRPIANLCGIFIIFLLGFGTILNLLLGTDFERFTDWYTAIIQPLVLVVSPIYWLPYDELQLNKSGGVAFLVICVLVLIARIIFYNFLLCILMVGWFYGRERFLEYKAFRSPYSMMMYLRERIFDDHFYAKCNRFRLNAELYRRKFVAINVNDIKQQMKQASLEKFKLKEAQYDLLETIYEGVSEMLGAPGISTSEIGEAKKKTRKSPTK